MNLHEYQAKELLAQYGVAVPAGDVCETPEAAKRIAEELFSSGANLIAVKSQIHAGGRGKGTFKSGYQGGVKLCKTAEDVFEKAKAMLDKYAVMRPAMQQALDRLKDVPTDIEPIFPLAR